MLDRHWHLLPDEYWDCSDVEIWRRRLKFPSPPDLAGELFEVLKGGQVPLIGIPVQPNILWPKERQEEFLWKERVGSGPKRDGAPMPTRISPEYLAEVDIHASASGGAAELWWNCGLPAWRFVHFARDELIRAYMAYLELPPGVAASDPPPQLPDASPDALTSRQPLGAALRFEPKTLAELLEWRNLLPGWRWRPTLDYLEELRRLCAWGRIPVLGRPVLDGFGMEAGEPQSVPAEAFQDYRLSQEFATNHGCLCKGLTTLVWTDLRFPGNPCRLWQAALEAGEIRAPRASSPLPEAAQPIPAVPAAPLRRF